MATTTKLQTNDTLRNDITSGKLRYDFTSNPGDNALDAIRDGRAISESVNGAVSLVRWRLR